MSRHQQPPLFVTSERHVSSPPLIKSPGDIVECRFTVLTWQDEGLQQVSMQSSSALTDELYEWLMPPVVTGREHHGRQLADQWRRFLRLHQEATAPF